MELKEIISDMYDVYGIRDECINYKNSLINERDRIKKDLGIESFLELADCNPTEVINYFYSFDGWINELDNLILKCDDAINILLNRLLNNQNSLTI